MAREVPTAPVAAGSVVTGYLVARETGKRPLGGVVLSHPLAKRIGAWPAVLVGAAASGGASWILADRARGD